RPRRGGLPRHRDSPGCAVPRRLTPVLTIPERPAALDDGLRSPPCTAVRTKGSPAAMTDSSVTPITAASNGGTTTDSSPQEAPAGLAKPERGIARLRETEVYHLTCLVESALYEAEHLVREVKDKARDRWLDHDHTTEPLNADELSRLLS